MELPLDGHVHTEWSWEAPGGSMERSCARALELGLPGIAFTEHGDLTPWVIPPELEPRLPARFRERLRPDGVLTPPDLDVAGYLAAVGDCRERFPSLRIVAGIELSEPHRHPERVAAVLAGGGFDRVLGSVHSAWTPDGFLLVDDLFRTRPTERVVRDYLAEVLLMIDTCDAFGVLAHIDYPLRCWPQRAGPVVIERFEDEFRTVLRALAASGRALEVNLRVPLPAAVLRWWREAGGPDDRFRQRRARAGTGRPRLHRRGRAGAGARLRARTGSARLVAGPRTGPRPGRAEPERSRGIAPGGRRTQAAEAAPATITTGSPDHHRRLRRPRPLRGHPRHHRPARGDREANRTPVVDSPPGPVDVGTGHRQGHREGAAPLRRRLGTDGTTVGLHDPPGDRQAEPRPTGVPG
jgi:histidinol-phosphatase (PHP family)